MNEKELLKMIKDLKSSLDFYKSRCEQLQQQQSKMRDPERTIVCDILANGKLLYPDMAGDRYSLNPEKCPETCIYKQFSENIKNAAEHDALTIAKERERVRPTIDQCESSLKRAIERSNELHKMAIDGGATPQNQGQFIALLESTIRDIEHLKAGEP